MKKQSIINILITMAYLILMGLLIFNVFELQDKYNKEEVKMIMEVEKAIQESLEAGSDEAIGKALTDARDQHGFDIVVTRKEEIIYKSVPYQIGESLLGRTHESARSREAQGYHDVGDNRFFVWYSIYKLNDSVFINSFLEIVLVLILIITALVILTVGLIFKSLFDPLKNIKRSIQLAQQYDFELIEQSDDSINQDFKSFVSRLEDDISVVSRQHTELEKQLQVKREHLNNIVVVSRSMVHDLKTPVHRIILENERYAREHNHEDVQEITKLNQDLNHDIMIEINRILKMLKDDNDPDAIETVEIDIVETVLRAISSFNKEITDNNLILDIDAPASIIKTLEETTFILLINNLLSNIVAYANPNSEVSIFVDEVDDQTILRFSNEASKENIERMQDTAKLFNAIKDDKEDKYVYSSGNGLYLIKELTRMLQGNYNLKINDNHVIIEVILNA